MRQRFLSARAARPGARQAVLTAALAAAWAGTLTGKFILPTGGAVSDGTLLLTLSQQGVTGGPAYAIVPQTATCYTSTDGSVVGVPNPQTGPGGSAFNGLGTLPAGVYFVEIAYTGASATTSLVSPESQLSLSSAGELQIPPPALQPAAATGFAVYIGTSSGFNLSQAAAYLACKSPASAEFPAGRTYVLEEYTAKHQPAAEFALALRERFAQPQRRLLGWYLSPDAWSQRGDGHSLADQMIAASGIGFQPASTDRIGGAMLIYSQLDRGELLIADTCRQLVETLPTRIHDPARPDDIAKIAGDPLDDCVDALRYALYSFIAPAQRTGAAFDPATASGDPTLAMLQRQLAEQRWQRQPSRYLPVRRPTRG